MLETVVGTVVAVATAACAVLYLRSADKQRDRIEQKLDGVAQALEHGGLGAFGKQADEDGQADA